MSKTQLGRDTAGPYETPTSRMLATKRFLQKRPVQVSLMLVLAAVIVFSWQLLNNTANSTDPSIAGHPLSNSHTHLHTIALGVRPGTLYLGTHFGMFTSTDGGKSWPQPRGTLNTMMITAIAASPSHPDNLAVVAIPVSGVGVQSGVYFSHDGGNTWNASSPAGLSLSAYPYTVKAGSAAGGHFYAFYNYAGWYETRDMGLHWYAITAGALSNMQTPSLLTDPANADHLWLGGDSGLYETRDDGKHWTHIATVKGNVAAIVASTTTPRLIFCATDQGIYRWYEGDTQITQLTHLPMSPLPSRLVVDSTGSILYALSGQDLWQTSDSGASWVHRSRFDRGDIIALVVDPSQPQHLYAGFFLPAEVLASVDGGGSWQTLTS